MPRTPTDNLRGRPKGSGRLTPAQTGAEAQTRVTVRLPTTLYDRLEAFTAGCHVPCGSPQLARCVREALEEYLERHSKRQTANSPLASVDNKRQTSNVLQASVRRTAPQQPDPVRVSSPATHPAQRGTMRQRILALLQTHPAGLSARQMQTHLGVDKPLAHTLSGMVRDRLLEQQDSGKAIRSRATTLSSPRRSPYGPIDR
jgi:hypothetical protein